MLSFKVTKPPENFPFPSAIKKMWSVVYFETETSDTTRVRLVSLTTAKSRRRCVSSSIAGMRSR